jgi:hypothetical protein
MADPIDPKHTMGNEKSHQHSWQCVCRGRGTVEEGPAGATWSAPCPGPPDTVAMHGEVYVRAGDVRNEWRFFWPHADDDMNGARPRREPPSNDEIAEWRADMATVWVERRVVYEGPWKRCRE